MSRIEKFEDLIPWQKSHVITRVIYALINCRLFARDFALKEQIRRSAISVLSNSAEGLDRGNPGEFHQFSVFAKGSCTELQSSLYIAVDAGEGQGQGFFSKANERARILGGLRVSVVKNDGVAKSPPYGVTPVFQDLDLPDVGLRPGKTTKPCRTKFLHSHPIRSGDNL